MTAIWSGKYPSLFVALTSAPCLMRNSVTFARPYAAPVWSGVKPDSPFAFTLAPCSIRILTMFSWPANQTNYYQKFCWIKKCKQLLSILSSYMQCIISQIVWQIDVGTAFSECFGEWCLAWIINGPTMEFSLSSKLSLTKKCLCVLLLCGVWAITILRWRVKRCFSIIILSINIGTVFQEDRNHICSTCNVIGSKLKVYLC